MSLYIGLDLGGTNLKYALGDERGTIITKSMRPSQAQESREKIFENMFLAVEELLKIAKQKAERVAAIGVGSPGSVDFEKGQLIGPTPNIKAWTDAPIKETLEARFHIPVWADNDANVVAIAEARLGAGKGLKHLVCLTVGTGIGGGIIIDGQIYRGENYTAAEIGHMSIEVAGKKCNCGGIGCLEVYTSAPAMVERYREKLEKTSQPWPEEKLSTELIFERMKAGDILALETLNETCDYFGAGIASVVNVLNPQAVIIGGGVAEAGEEFIGRVREVVKRRAMKAATKNLQILKAQLGNDAGVVGAILIAAEQCRAIKTCGEME
ncbi:MAG: ROK family protein [candidate division KSB1 bacterium]|nr:ROK family protein [candidate division KSB1 bacterium]